MPRPLIPPRKPPELLGFYMDKDTLAEGKTSRTRSMVYLGAPLDGYGDSSEDQREQNEKHSEYILKGEPTLFERFDMPETMGSQNPFLRSPYMKDPETKSKMDVDLSLIHI